MQHKTFFLYLAMAAAFTGCLKVQKKSEVAAQQAKTQAKQSQPRQVLSRELRLDDVFIEFVGQQRPNVYDVLFSWPETRDTVRISIENKIITTKKTAEFANYTMSNRSGGDKFTVLVEILDQENRVLAHGLRDLEIPEDYVFPEQFVLSYDAKIYYNRVFMNNSVITTQNFNLQIVAKELIILNNSSIQGFADGTKAAPGNSGRSGGVIDIEIESGKGSLAFLLNSEAGGNGLQGYYEMRVVGKEKNDHYFPKCVNGGPGYPAGRNSHLRLKVARSENLTLTSRTTYSTGGSLAPRLGTAPYGYPSLPEGSGCTDNPAPGAGAQEGISCIMLDGVPPAPGCQ